MAENFYTIITTVGQAKIANAQVTGQKVNLTEIAAGDGGGAYYNPDQTQTALKNEIWRGNISAVQVDEQNPNWIVIEGVILSTEGGFFVREVGVFDEDGDLIAIGKYPETYKPATTEGSAKDLYIRMIIEVSNASAVTLRVDPSVIIASRKYVDDKIAPVEQKANQTASALAAHLNEIATIPGPNKIPRADSMGKIDKGWLNGLLIGNNPVCILEHSADQAIPGDGSLVALAFDFEWIDTDNMHSTTTNNSRITINTPGIYLIYGFVVFGNQSKTGTRSLTIRKNGTTLIAQNLVNAVQLSSFTTNLSIAAIANLAIGDYVELLVSQNSGVTLTVPTNITEPAIHPGFGAIKVG